MTYISDVVSRGNISDDLDMQGNRLIGLPNPSNADEIVRKADIGVLGLASSVTYDAPVLSEFTNLNMSGTTAASEGSGSITIQYNQTNFQGAGLTYPLPTPPWTLTTRLTILINPGGFSQGGLGVTDDTKIEWWPITYNPGSLPQLNITAQRLNSMISFNSDFMSTRAWFFNTLWWKIRDDGVNRVYSISNEGVQYIRLATMARTTFLTPTKLIVIAAAASGVDTSVNIQSWKVTQG